MNLPDDITELIFQHLAAIKIQVNYRRHMYRHTAHPLWIYLLKKLKSQLLYSEFEILQCSGRIRGEWRSELESWLYPDVPIRIIFKEIYDDFMN
jgi:hypothetical protein